MSGPVSNWERATRIYGAARELEPGPQALFVDYACAGDPELQAAVDSLLRDGPPDSFLAQSAWTQIGVDRPVLAPHLEPGHLLKERYRIEKRLGSGGQALVYSAADESLSRPVVIKVMRAGGRLNPLLRGRFEKEMRALTRIEHPGVVGILDVGELDDGSPFLVIQYVNGVSLRELLRAGPLAAASAENILRQLGAALGAAHAAGVVHADLKPENVLLQHSPHGADLVKLIDFGIAKVERSELDADVTTVMVAGTVRYMAPEQFEGRNLPASDVYGFGLIACELLCGEPDPRPLRKKAPAAVVRLLERALAYRAEDRPADIAQFARTLGAALASPTYPRRYAVMAVVSMALVGAGLAAGRFFTEAPSEPRIIEKVGAFDPLEEGFQIHNQISGTVVPNPAGDGFDAWQVSSPNQGHYFRSLSLAQKRLALANGWTLSVRMRVDTGAVGAGVDFVGVGRRFIIGLYREAEGMLVRLQTQTTPTFQGLDLMLPHDTAYHLYELRYDPGLQAADLWINGERRLTGYRGLTQYQGDGDVYFSAVTYKNSARGAGAFKSVRFEIHPGLESRVDTSRPER